MTHSINRRDLFSLVAVTAAGGALMTQRAFAEGAGAATTTLMPGADVCVITPEVTEGPYYFDPSLERADIREDRTGVAATVRLQVVDATCRPVEGARVDIWHCDAEGLYSGYANQTGGVDTTGATFLRGTQFTGSTGIAEFKTIYPGWYAGRTTHIHFKVFLDAKTVLTGQIFFPDALSQFIYQNVAPYTNHGADRTTLNGNDSIATQATRASFAYVKELAEEYLVAMIIGIDPNAASVAGMDGFGGAGPRADGPPPDGAGGPPPSDTAALGDEVSLVPGVPGIH